MCANKTHIHKCGRKLDCNNKPVLVPFDVEKADHSLPFMKYLKSILLLRDEIEVRKRDQDHEVKEGKHHHCSERSDGKGHGEGEEE